MKVNISVIPGYYNLDIGTHRDVIRIFQKALSTLLEQKENPNMEIIVESISKQELFRSIYPDPTFPNETPEHFCLRVQKEIKHIV